MLAEPFLSRAVVVDLWVTGGRLEIAYSVDGESRGMIRIGYPAPALIEDAALDVIACAAGIYLGSLCLASEVRIERECDPRLLEALLPIAEMTYEIRRWKDHLPLGAAPTLLAPVRAGHCLPTLALDDWAATALWSGGKDSTLALLTLQANGYTTRAVHMQGINVGVDVLERQAVSRLASRLGEKADAIEIEHEDFLALSGAYAREWDTFPLCNRVPFGRDLLLAALSVPYALGQGTAHIAMGHDNECRNAEVLYRGRRIPRNDLESAVGSLLLEQALRCHVHPDLRLLPPVSNLSELRILRDMLVYHEDMMSLTSFCFWGENCGRCTKCLRYYLADQLYGSGSLSFAVNPLARGACPELADYFEPNPRSTIFQNEILFMLARLAQCDGRPREEELDHFHETRFDSVVPMLDRWEIELLGVRGDPQLPSGFLPLHREPGPDGLPEALCAGGGYQLVRAA